MTVFKNDNGPKRFFIILSYALLLAGPGPSALAKLPKGLEQQLDWELNANNNGATRGRGSAPHFKMYHYEIPMAYLSNQSYTSGISPELKSALIFNKNGVETIRWIINPEDTKYVAKMEKFLLEKGLDTTKHQYFTGHLTASRSMYVEAPNPQNPGQPILFSGKVSTNRTGGKFKNDKYVDLEQIQDSHVATVLAQKVQKNGNIKFSTLKLMEEPAGFYLEGQTQNKWPKEKIQQGYVIRSLDAIAHGDNYYLPGFSALNTQIGAEIARLNGSNNPKQFWTEHYVKAIGRACAEFSAHLGLSMTSAHNQQWLVELDKNKKPTGKVVLRDFNDSHVIRPFYGNSRDPLDQKVLATWGREKKYSKDHLYLQVGLFHGTEVPAWIKKSEASEVNREFFNAFHKKFSEITGIPLKELMGKPPKIYNPPKYSVKSFRPTYKGHWTLGWRRYFAAGPCFRGGDYIVQNGVKRDCREVLKELSVKSQVPYTQQEDLQDLGCHLERIGDFKSLKSLAKTYKRTMKDFVK